MAIGRIDLSAEEPAAVSELWGESLPESYAADCGGRSCTSTVSSIFSCLATASSIDTRGCF